MSSAADVSVLTLVRGRRPQLRNLVTGLAESEESPRELVIAAMDDLSPAELPDAPFPLRIVRVPQPGSVLPLAAARNAAAEAARGEVLLFLDVDCVPHPALCTVLAKAARDTGGVVMGEVYYLPEGALDAPWRAADLHARAEHHPRRPTLAEGEVRPAPNYALLWSLCIAMTRDTYARSGGFDVAYPGYGAEDTDFAFALEARGIPFHLVGAYAYHQYHPVYRPPVRLAEDLAANSRYFYAKWGRWPMEGWLAGLAELGIIAWTPEGDTIEYLRPATQQEIDDSLVRDGKGY